MIIFTKAWEKQHILLVNGTLWCDYSSCRLQRDKHCEDKNVMSVKTSTHNIKIYAWEPRLQVICYLEVNTSCNIYMILTFIAKCIMEYMWCSSKMLVTTYKTTHCNNTENHYQHLKNIFNVISKWTLCF